VEWALSSRPHRVASSASGAGERPTITWTQGGSVPRGPTLLLQAESATLEAGGLTGFRRFDFDADFAAECERSCAVRTGCNQRVENDRPARHAGYRCNAVQTPNARFGPRNRKAELCDFRGLRIGETGFEPATARPPAGAIQFSQAAYGGVERSELLSVALSGAQFGPRNGPQQRKGGWPIPPLACRVEAMPGDRRDARRAASQRRRTAARRIGRAPVLGRVRDQLGNDQDGRSTPVRIDLSQPAASHRGARLPDRSCDRVGGHGRGDRHVEPDVTADALRAAGCARDLLRRCRGRSRTTRRSRPPRRSPSGC
jgi:hypothetical protein